MNKEPEKINRKPDADRSSNRVLAVVLLLAIVIGVMIFHLKRNQPPTLPDLKTPRITPAASILYRELSQIRTGFNESRGLAIHNQFFYVAGDKAVVRFDRQGNREEFAKLAGKPQCIAILSDGTLFVAMQDHVQVFDRDGKQTASWPALGAHAVITSLALSKAGLWAADAGNKEIVLLDLSGTILRRLGKRDDMRKIPGLVIPSPYLDVAVAADGNIVVGNTGRRQVEYYTPSGDLMRSWGISSNAEEGFAGCCNPTDFALLPDGRVVTSEKGIPRVKLYTADGQYQGMVAPPELFNPSTAGLDLAVDDSGSIYVLDPKANTVRVFLPKGEGKR